MRARFTWGGTTIWDEVYTYPGASWTLANPQWSLRYKIVNATAQSTVLQIYDYSGGGNAGM